MLTRRWQPSLLALLIGAVAASGAGCAGGAVLRIDSVSPERLAAAGSAQLILIGTGFRDGDRISLNSTPLNGSIWVNDRLLSVPLPSGFASGLYDVIVTAPDGRQAVLQHGLQIGAVATNAATAAAGRTALAQPSPTRIRETATATPGPSVTPSPAPTPSPNPSPPPRPTATASAAALNVSGQWRLVDTISATGEQFTFDIVLTQQGNAVSGSGGGIEVLGGSLNDHTLTASYRAQNGTSGIFRWTFSADGSSFSGTFTSTAPNSGSSAGVRTGAAAPRLMPPRQFARLRPVH